MGYQTDFSGEFTLNKQLTEETQDFLQKLSETRRMGRNIEGFGVQGEFYVAEDGYRSPNIIDNNRPPSTQPGLWCGWEPTPDGHGIHWNEQEKFYNYPEWLVYIIDRVLIPNGYILNGSVAYRGEEFGDAGELVVVDNEVTLKPYKGEETFYPLEFNPTELWIEGEATVLPEPNEKADPEIQFLEGLVEQFNMGLEHEALFLIEKRLAQLK